MRTLIVLCSCILVSSGLAFGQAGFIGVYADPGGTTCNIPTNAVGLLDVYVVMTEHGGINAVQFSAPMPSCFNGVWLADSSPWMILMGNSQTGILLGVPGCDSAPSHVLTITYLTLGPNYCCPYPVLPDPSVPSGLIEAAQCGPTIVYPVALTSVLDGDDTCPCGDGVNLPPVASCQDVTVPADATCTADASIDNGSYDPDGDAITLTQTPPGPYPIGTTSVTLTVEDDRGGVATCTGDVTVIDTIPPEITVTLSRDCLWPPNHKMADIWVTVDMTDDCCAMYSYQLLSVLSNEPDNGKGDGNTTGDIMIVSDDHVRLRSERSGGGDGRIYTLTYEVVSCGRTDTVTADVRVPHDHSGWAVASLGFESEGIGFDPALDEFVLVIRSRAAGTLVDGVFFDEDFDATALDVTRTYVGNVKGVVLPHESLEIDNDADDLIDLALYYSASEVNRLMASATPTGDGEVEITETFGPIGLHYTGADGTDYLVPNIFNLGEPVPLVPEIGIIGRVGERDSPTPTVTERLSAYPNPFNPRTTIVYATAESGVVRLSVYDVTGRLTKRLVNGTLPGGEHSVAWDGRDESGTEVSTGVYLVKLEASGTVSTCKIVFMK